MDESDRRTPGIASLPNAAVEHKNLANRRRSRRRRTLKTGIVAFLDRHCSIKCIVRDVSDDGARLRATDTLNIPDRFELLVEMDGFEADCEVVWRKQHDLGVKFLSPPRKVNPGRVQSVRADRPQATISILRRPVVK